MDGSLRATTQVGHGVFEIPIDFNPARTDAVTVEISIDPAYRPEGDNRELGFVLMEVRAGH